VIQTNFGINQTEIDQYNTMSTRKKERKLNQNFQTENEKKKRSFQQTNSIEFVDKINWDSQTMVDYRMNVWITRKKVYARQDRSVGWPPPTTTMRLAPTLAAHHHRNKSLL
jgi:predicted GTPase